MNKPTGSSSPQFVSVCKRVFHADPTYYPQALYRGKTIYFCTEACLGAFLADPDRFYRAHSTTGTQKESQERRARSASLLTYR